MPNNNIYIQSSGAASNGFNVVKRASNIQNSTQIPKIRNGKVHMIITCGIYLYDTRNKKILVCHATRARWNQWSIPKGLKEDGEEFLAVGIRELQEETGIDIVKLHVLATHQLPSVKYQKQNKTLESFLVITDSDLDGFHFSSNMISNRAFPEVDKWKWISLEEVNNWLHESQCKNLAVIQKLVRAHF